MTKNSPAVTAPQKPVDEFKSRREAVRIAIPISALVIGIGILATPIILFFIQVFVGGYAPSESIEDIRSKQFQQGHNLFLLAAVASIPFFALAVLQLVLAITCHRSTWYWMTVAGLFGIFAVMVPSHYAVWAPLYGPGRMSSTAVIAFLFIPFLCLGGMAAFMLLMWLFTWLARRIRRLAASQKTHFT